MATLEESKNNISSITDKWDNLTVKFFSVNLNKKTTRHIYPSNGGSGGSTESFYRSAQFLINEAVNIKSKYGVFWLEDDWENKGNKSLLDILKGIDFGVDDYMPLAQQQGVSGNPGIWGSNLFKTHAFTRVNDESTEHFLGNWERVVVFGNRVKGESQISGKKTLSLFIFL